VDRRRALRLMGMGLASSVAAPWVVGCSSGGGTSSGAGGTTTRPDPPPPTSVGHGRLGALEEPDANGLRLPEGFSSRVVATSGQEVVGTGYPWPGDPGSGATFALPGGLWSYVSNGGPPGAGVVSVIGFSADGSIYEAARILDGTDALGAGGVTPGDTWLSGETGPEGQVWECDPSGEEDPVAHPGMGSFRHGGVAVDPEAGVVYLSEDEPDGALYRFTPDAWPDLTTGTLAVLTGPEGDHRWVEVPDPAGGSARPTRHQVDAVVRFDGGVGLAQSDNTTYITTRGDDRVRFLKNDELTVIYDPATTDATEGGEPVLSGVGHIAVGLGGDRYIAESGGDGQIVRIGPGGFVEPVVQLVGVEGSAITGPAFSPDGTRLYFSSRSPGVTYEVMGPFPLTAPG